MINRTLFFVFTAVLIFLLAYTVDVPLLGAHQWRQADTNFMSYSFCFETTDILRPRVPMRGDTEGISIGEFPVYNWITGMTCRALGGWSEALPKVISFVFMMCSAVVWGLALTETASMFWAWMTLFCFSSLSFVYLNHAMPEGLSLLFVGLGALSWKKQQNNFVGGFLGACCFTLGFLIRPYLVGLLFISAKNRRQYIWALPLIFVGYFFWYKYWASIYTTPYFHITPKPINEALQELPRAILLLFVHLGKWHLNWVALVPFVYGALKNIKLAGLLALTALIVFITSGYHFDAHPYYLFAVLIFALVITLEGLKRLQLSPKALAASLFVYGVIAIAGRFNEFMPPKDTFWQQIPKLIAEANIQQQERITTANGWDPIWLYYAKRPGYAVEPGSSDLCQGSSVAVLYKEADQVHLKSCR